MLVTVIVFLFVLSLLVIVHEFGHFIVAKKAGIGVWEFALGLPFTRPIWSMKLKSGMLVSVYPLLFGGFVRLLGEDPGSDGDKEIKDEIKKAKIKGLEFYKSSLSVRFGVVVAGVAMNFILGVVLFYIFLSLTGFRVLIPRFSDYKFLSPTTDGVVVTYVAKDSPGEKAGLVYGEIVSTIDGQRVMVTSDFQKYVKEKSGKEITMTMVDRDMNKTRSVVVTPRVNPPKGEGPIGVGIGQGVIIKYETFSEKLLSGLTYSVDMIVYNFKVIGQFIGQARKTGDIGIVQQNISGPIGIAVAIGEILKLPLSEAVTMLINFTGILSLSLAVINLLPIPAMDGGRAVFLIYELIFRRRFPMKYELWVNQVGMVGLLILMALITISDVRIRVLGW